MHTRRAFDLLQQCKALPLNCIYCKCEILGTPSRAICNNCAENIINNPPAKELTNKVSIQDNLTELVRPYSDAMTKAFKVHWGSSTGIQAVPGPGHITIQPRNLSRTLSPRPYNGEVWRTSLRKVFQKTPPIHMWVHMKNFHTDWPEKVFVLKYSAGTTTLPRFYAGDVILNSGRERSLYYVLNIGRSFVYGLPIGSFTSETKAEDLSIQGKERKLPLTNCAYTIFPGATTQIKSMECSTALLKEMLQRHS